MTALDPHKVPGLPGRWAFWSKAADQPGARFVVPSDDAARGSGVKYAVVKTAKEPKSGDKVVVLIRTDPPRELTQTKET